MFSDVGSTVRFEYLLLVTSGIADPWREQLVFIHTVYSFQYIVCLYDVGP